METEMVPIEVKKTVLSIQQQANALIVSNPDEAERGASILKELKSVEDALLGRKEEITRPLMRSLASVRDLFKPLELNIKDAKNIIKSKLLAYDIEAQHVREAEEAKITTRLEKGTMRADTAASKLAALGDTPKTKGMQIRTLKKLRVIDETIIPREYLVPDMGKITKAMLHTDIDIPGVERYEEKIAAIA